MLMLAPPGGLVALHAAACCVAARTAVHGKHTVEAFLKATMHRLLELPAMRESRHDRFASL
jgi:hypothetical protein